MTTSSEQRLQTWEDQGYEDGVKFQYRRYTSNLSLVRYNLGYDRGILARERDRVTAAPIQETLIPEMLAALEELVAEFDARSVEAATAPGVIGLFVPEGIWQARTVLAKYKDLTA